MAVNLFANQLNAKVARTTKNWLQLGFDSSNVEIVYLLDPTSAFPVLVWKPNDPFSQLTGIEAGKGYIIQPKINLDRESDFISPIPVFTTTTTTSTSSSTTTTTTTVGTTTSSTTTSTTTSAGGQTFTITGTNNNLIVDGTPYSCGDTIQLRGTFAYLLFENLSGCEGNPIKVVNYPGETVTIGNPNWNSGGFASALSFRNAHYIELEGETISSIQIQGSTQSNRAAYYNLAFSRLSDNINASNITINNGGTGIWCKTDPVNGQPDTYSDLNAIKPPIMNYSFHDIILSGTLPIGIYNEGMYIGHTATYWNLTTNQPFYGTIGDPATGWIEGDYYVIPRTLGNVEIYNMYLNKIGLDGIQCSNVDGLNIYRNEVTNWALLRDAAHNGGILVGGRSKNSIVTCNYVHDGWGELFQFYGSGEGGATHLIYNNLFRDNGVDENGNVVNSATGASFRGTDAPNVQFYNNTISRTGGSSTRWNGTRGMTDVITISRNVLIQPRRNGGNTGVDSAYVYTENGAAIVQDTPPNDNKKYLTVGASGLDPNNYYMPLQGSPVGMAGVRYNLCDPAVTTTTSTSTSSTTTTSTTAGTTTTTTSTSSTTTTSTTGSPGVPSFTAIQGYNSSTPNQYGWLYLPPDYNPSGPALPFMIFLHGLGERGSGGTGAATPNINKVLEAGTPKYLSQGDLPSGIVIFSPQLSAATSTWEPPTIEAARSWVLNNYNVDNTRFYLTGLSLGGSGTSKYVYTYPDRVAAYLLATADTQYQRGANASRELNGIRMADVPGWFHGGTTDDTINVNNGVQSLTALNNLSPKPIYPWLVNTYWNVGHTSALWDTQVYNRKNKTTGGGTSTFDYIDWFKKYKINDLQFGATSNVVVAEATNDWSDYKIALDLVNKLSNGTPKTNLLNRLAVVKSTIETTWRVIEGSFGAATVPGNINTINTSGTGQSTSLVDVNGNSTGISFVLVSQGLTPPNVTINNNNSYLGEPTEFWINGYRLSNGTNTWRWTGLSDGKTYKIRFFYSDMQQNTTVHWGAVVTISGNTQTLENEIVNTTKYVDFNSLSSTSGQISASLSPIQSGAQGNIAGFVLFESVSGGTTTTSTSSTTTTTTTQATTTSTSTTTLNTTTSSTTTTTTTVGTTTSSTTTSTTTVVTTTTTSTSTTSTSTSSTTTTSTTIPAGQARFNFNLTAQNTSGWKDVSGNPHLGVITATDDINGTNYRITSISGKWGNFGGNSANNANGTGTATSDFPTAVMQSFWFNYSQTYPANGADIKLDQLLPNTNYRLKMIGSRSSVNGGGIPSGQLRLMEFDVSQVATIGDPSEQSIQNYPARDSLTTQTFDIQSNASGEIYIGVYSSRTGDATNNDRFGFINGLIVQPI